MSEIDSDRRITRGRNASYKQALNNIPEEEVIEMPKKGETECPTGIEEERFEKMNAAEKMSCIVSTINQLCVKAGEVDKSINAEPDGILAKTNALQTTQNQEGKDIEKIVKENIILRGIVQRQHQQISHLNDKVTGLTMKSMEQNLMISGLVGDVKTEDCKDTVVKFLRSQVEIDAAEEELLVAHRVGKWIKDSKIPRMMVIKATYDLRDRILANKKNLKDKKNENDGAFYINKQLPESVVEQNRDISQTIRDQKEKDKDLPIKDGSKIEVRDKTVYVDGSPVKKILTAPQPLELFPDNPEKNQMEKIKLSASDMESEQGSDFQAYAVKTGQFLEVQRAYRKVRTVHPSATHVMATFNLKSTSGFQDDGEFGPAHKLLKQIKGGAPHEYSHVCSPYIWRNKAGKEKIRDYTTVSKTGDPKNWKINSTVDFQDR